MALISDNALTYSNPKGDFKVWFSAQGGVIFQGGLIFKQTYPSGSVSMVALKPVWTLVEAERAAALIPAAR